jgi:hypothetical protein
MLLTLVGLVIAVLLAGQGLARLDEARLRVARRTKLLEQGWA